MDGILNIDKPLGKTSFNVVAAVKRWTGEKRVGHAGTLDPMASGVLPVCLGQATRLVEYLMDTCKTYRAEIEMGITTDTYDVEGEVTQTSDTRNITRRHVTDALSSFTGTITQTPPMYSALKHHGKPLYQLAREGITVAREARRVVIHNIELKSWQNPLAVIEVVCSKGTYIRSLAHDLGQMLGCGARLKNLVRLQCGIFDISTAITLEELQEAGRAGYLEKYLVPMDSVLSHWPAIVVGPETESLIRHGTSIPLRPKETSDNLCRAYNQCGFLLGVLQFDDESGMWHPEKVFR